MQAKGQRSKILIVGSGFGGLGMVYGKPEVWARLLLRWHGL